MGIKLYNDSEGVIDMIRVLREVYLTENGKLIQRKVINTRNDFIENMHSGCSNRSWQVFCTEHDLLKVGETVIIYYKEVK